MYSKKWYRSRGVWGGIIAVAASLLALWGIDVSADMQTELINYIVAAGASAGGILAVIGRVMGDRRIE